MGRAVETGGRTDRQGYAEMFTYKEAVTSGHVYVTTSLLITNSDKSERYTTRVVLQRNNGTSWVDVAQRQGWVSRTSPMYRKFTGVISNKPLRVKFMILGWEKGKPAVWKNYYVAV